MNETPSYVKWTKYDKARGGQEDLDFLGMFVLNAYLFPS